MWLPQSRSSSASSPAAVPDDSWRSVVVVCGADFTPSSEEAARVAATLAQRLILVHIVDETTLPMGAPEGMRAPMVRAVCDRLHEEENALRGLHTVSIRTDVRLGRPAALLRQETESSQARLIVLGATRRGARPAWPERSVAEEVAETAKIPTLIVHQAAPLLEWLQGERPLRVFVAADLSAPSEAALYWADWLRTRAPCEIFAACLGKEPDQVRSDETVPSLFLGEMVAKAAHTPERLFEEKIRTRLGLSHVHMRFGKDAGHSAATLLQLALEERADLMIVGTHSRQGWHRIGHPSVSRFMLRQAPLNVLVCPEQPDLA